MCLPGALELRHAAAVELEVGRLRERLADVVGERDRDDAVAPTPHEQRGLNLSTSRSTGEAVDPVPTDMQKTSYPFLAQRHKHTRANQRERGPGSAR